jgi:hypothetical protein
VLSQGLLSRVLDDRRRATISMVDGSAEQLRFELDRSGAGCSAETGNPRSIHELSTATEFWIQYSFTCGHDMSRAASTDLCAAKSTGLDVAIRNDMRVTGRRVRG